RRPRSDSSALMSAGVSTAATHRDPPALGDALAVFLRVAECLATTPRAPAVLLLDSHGDDDLLVLRGLVGARRERGATLRLPVPVPDPEAALVRVRSRRTRTAVLPVGT